jgi:hypothetical protein
LIILERVGSAIRNPPRDVMLSHAGKQIGGYGWAFGLLEAVGCSPMIHCQKPTFNTMPFRG